MNDWWKDPRLDDEGTYDYLIEELPKDYGEWIRHSKCDCCGKERLFAFRYVHHFYCWDGWDSMDSTECWKCMIKDKIWSIRHKVKKRIEVIKTTFELYNTQSKSKRDIKKCYNLALRLHRQQYKINIERKKPMIKIKQAIEKPVEDDNHWSYPVSELDYLLEEKEDGVTFLLYDSRLYEAD